MSSKPQQHPSSSRSSQKQHTSSNTAALFPTSDPNYKKELASATTTVNSHNKGQQNVASRVPASSLNSTPSLGAPPLSKNRLDTAVDSEDVIHRVLSSVTAPSSSATSSVVSGDEHVSKPPMSNQHHHTPRQKKKISPPRNNEDLLPTKQHEPERKNVDVESKEYHRREELRLMEQLSTPQPEARGHLSEDVSEDFRHRIILHQIAKEPAKQWSRPPSHTGTPSSGYSKHSSPEHVQTWVEEVSGAQHERHQLEPPSHRNISPSGKKVSPSLTLPSRSEESTSKNCYPQHQKEHSKRTKSPKATDGLVSPIPTAANILASPFAQQDPLNENEYRSTTSSKRSSRRVVPLSSPSPLVENSNDGVQVINVPITIDFQQSYTNKKTHHYYSPTNSKRNKGGSKGLKSPLPNQRLGTGRSTSLISPVSGKGKTNQQQTTANRLQSPDRASLAVYQESIPVVFVPKTKTSMTDPSMESLQQEDEFVDLTSASPLPHRVHSPGTLKSSEENRHGLMLSPPKHAITTVLSPRLHILLPPTREETTREESSRNIAPTMEATGKEAFSSSSHLGNNSSAAWRYGDGRVALLSPTWSYRYPTERKLAPQEEDIFSIHSSSQEASSSTVQPEVAHQMETVQYRIFSVRSMLAFRLCEQSESLERHGLESQSEGVIEMLKLQWEELKFRCYIERHAMAPYDEYYEQMVVQGRQILRTVLNRQKLLTEEQTQRGELEQQYEGFLRNTNAYFEEIQKKFGLIFKFLIHESQMRRQIESRCWSELSSIGMRRAEMIEFRRRRNFMLAPGIASSSTISSFQHIPLTRRETVLSYVDFVACWKVRRCFTQSNSTSLTTAPSQKGSAGPVSAMDEFSQEWEENLGIDPTEKSSQGESYHPSSSPWRFGDQHSDDEDDEKATLQDDWEMLAFTSQEVDQQLVHSTNPFRTDQGGRDEEEGSPIRLSTQIETEKINAIKERIAARKKLQHRKEVEKQCVQIKKDCTDQEGPLKLQIQLNQLASICCDMPKGNTILLEDEGEDSSDSEIESTALSRMLKVGKQFSSTSTSLSSIPMTTHCCVAAFHTEFCRRVKKSRKRQKRRNQELIHEEGRNEKGRSSVTTILPPEFDDDDDGDEDGNKGNDMTGHVHSPIALHRGLSRFILNDNEVFEFRSIAEYVGLFLPWLKLVHLHEPIQRCLLYQAEEKHYRSALMSKHSELKKYLRGKWLEEAQSHQQELFRYQESTAQLQRLHLREAELIYMRSTDIILQNFFSGIQFVEAGQRSLLLALESLQQHWFTSKCKKVEEKQILGFHSIKVVEKRERNELLDRLLAEQLDGTRKKLLGQLGDTRLATVPDEYEVSRPESSIDGEEVFPKSRPPTDVWIDSKELFQLADLERTGNVSLPTAIATLKAMKVEVMDPEWTTGEGISYTKTLNLKHLTNIFHRAIREELEEGKLPVHGGKHHPTLYMQNRLRKKVIPPNCVDGAGFERFLFYARGEKPGSEKNVLARPATHIANFQRDGKKHSSHEQDSAVKKQLPRKSVREKEVWEKSPSKPKSRKLQFTTVERGYSPNSISPKRSSGTFIPNESHEAFIRSLENVMSPSHHHPERRKILPNDKIHPSPLGKSEKMKKRFAQENRKKVVGGVSSTSATSSGNEMIYMDLSTEDSSSDQPQSSPALLLGAALSSSQRTADDPLVKFRRLENDNKGQNVKGEGARHQEDGEGQSTNINPAGEKALRLMKAAKQESTSRSTSQREASLDPHQVHPIESTAPSSSALTERQRSQCRALFRKADLNKDGRISFLELLTLLRGAGLLSEGAEYGGAGLGMGLTVSEITTIVEENGVDEQSTNNTHPKTISALQFENIMGAILSL